MVHADHTLSLGFLVSFFASGNQEPPNGSAFHLRGSARARLWARHDRETFTSTI